MVTISREAGAQTEARLRAVFRRSAISWLPGSWSFVEQDDAADRADWIALVRDEGQLSALCPASETTSETTEERFGVFRVVLPPGADDSGFVGWLASRIKAATGSGLFVVCGQNRERGGIFDFYGVPEATVPEITAVLERLGANHILDSALMRTVLAATNALIGLDTVFCFDMEGATVTAHYGGGPVTNGWLVGTIEPPDHPQTAVLRFRYLQVNLDGGVDSGDSTADLERLPDGRWRIAAAPHTASALRT
jgi:hypothetical protein